MTQPDDDLIDGAGIAKLFSVTRNQVYAWHTRRDRNGFPDEVKFRTVGCRRQYAARSARLWSRAAVLAWHASYIPKRGGAGSHKENCRCITCTKL